MLAWVHINIFPVQSRINSLITKCYISLFFQKEKHCFVFYCYWEKSSISISQNPEKYPDEYYTIPLHFCSGNQGPVAISEKTSHCKISQSIEAVSFVFRNVRLLWNFTSTSAGLLSMCVTNIKAMWLSKLLISRLQDFTRSDEKTSYQILKQGSGAIYSAVIRSKSLRWTGLMQTARSPCKFVSVAYRLD